MTSSAGSTRTSPAGTVVLITITDHASHMAGVTVVLTFCEG